MTFMARGMFSLMMVSMTLTAQFQILMAPSVEAASPMATMLRGLRISEKAEDNQPTKEEGALVGLFGGVVILLVIAYRGLRKMTFSSAQPNNMYTPQCGSKQKDNIQEIFNPAMASAATKSKAISSIGGGSVTTSVSLSKPGLPSGQMVHAGQTTAI